MTLIKKTSKKIIIFSLSILMLLALLLLFPFFKVVAFEHEDSGRMLAYFSVDEYQEFKILYTHSVHLTPVLESYQIREDKIVQTDIVYENFAIGMPSNAHGEEIFIVEDNGKYHIKNMNREFPFIDLRVGRVVSNHQLLLGNRKIPFTSFADAGDWIRIKVENKTIWQIMKGVRIDEYKST